jgi:hypothetical protein
LRISGSASLARSPSIGLFWLPALARYRRVRRASPTRLTDYRPLLLPCSNWHANNATLNTSPWRPSSLGATAPSGLAASLFVQISFLLILIVVTPSCICLFFFICLLCTCIDRTIIGSARWAGPHSSFSCVVLAMGFRGAGLPGINRSADGSAALPPFEFPLLCIRVAPPARPDSVLFPRRQCKSRSSAHLFHVPLAPALTYLNIFTVEEYEREGKTQKRWTKIGAAFPSKEGIGFNRASKTGGFCLSVQGQVRRGPQTNDASPCRFRAAISDMGNVHSRFRDGCSNYTQIRGFHQLTSAVEWVSNYLVAGAARFNCRHCACFQRDLHAKGGKS